ILEFLRGAFDQLPPRLQRSSLLTLLAARSRRICRCLPEEDKRASHVCYFIAAGVLNVDIKIAIGDTTHGSAEETESPRDVAPDIKPGHQGGTNDGGDGKHGKDELTGANLTARVARYLLGDAALLFHQVIDGGLELGSFSLCVVECQNGFMLLI